MSWLATLGKDIEKVFDWLGSPKGQAVIGTGESLLEVVDPALSGVIGITNAWIQEIYKAQALATAAAASPTTSGAKKAAIVLTTLTPQVIAFAEAQHLPVPTGTDLINANNALVAFLNALGASSTPTTSSTAATVTAAPSVQTQVSTGTLL